MKILIVCSKNSGKIAPFIVEQVEALRETGIEMDYYAIEQKGIIGYLKSRKSLLRKIKEFQPDLIHAHYGLSGLLANLQRRVPVVTTYHGSDINDRKVYPFSRLCMMLSVWNVFVSEKNMRKGNHLTPGPSPRGEGKRTPLASLTSFPFQGLSPNGERKRNKVFKGRKSVLIPCGVDVELFMPLDKTEARQKLKLDAGKQYVLFAGSFTNRVKNPLLAQEAAGLVPDVTLLELKGYTREKVALLMNAVDAVLMTSFTEGSPQFIKEAMACNCPVVSVPVGDVPEVISGVEGCCLAAYEPDDIAAKLQQVLDFGKRTEGRKRIVERGLDAASVAKRIGEVYEFIVHSS